MGDQVPEPNSPRQGPEKTEPVRSRWSPKPEQIRILESIFNSGMVNPPKEETVRIRQLLEKFGSVGDANVFYWFQNRRSRSRRRQRQIQAGLIGEKPVQTPTNIGAVPSSCFVGSTSSGSDGVDDLFSFSAQMGLPKIEQNSTVAASFLCPEDASNLNYQSGIITVFINGIPTEIPKGPLDMKATFGQDLVLVHSSGLPLPLDDYGFLVQSLQHGESYFLVSRPP